MNGRAYPDTLEPDSSPRRCHRRPGRAGRLRRTCSTSRSARGSRRRPGEQVLIRLANLGFQEQTLSMPGVPLRMVGNDARYMSPDTADDHRHGRARRRREPRRPPHRTRQPGTYPFFNTDPTKYRGDGNDQRVGGQYTELVVRPATTELEKGRVRCIQSRQPLGARPRRRWGTSGARRRSPRRCARRHHRHLGAGRRPVQPRRASRGHPMRRSRRQLAPGGDSNYVLTAESGIINTARRQQHADVGLRQRQRCVPVPRPGAVRQQGDRVTVTLRNQLDGDAPRSVHGHRQRQGQRPAGAGPVRRRRRLSR